MAIFKSKNLETNSCRDFPPEGSVSSVGMLEKKGGKQLQSVAIANTKRESAEYIREMIIVLRELADSSDLVFLAYLLDMAYEEADSSTKRA